MAIKRPGRWALVPRIHGRQERRLGEACLGLERSGELSYSEGSLLLLIKCWPGHSERDLFLYLGQPELWRGVLVPGNAHCRELGGLCLPPRGPSDGRCASGQGVM